MAGIALGTSEVVRELADMLCAAQTGRVEMFPFPSLTGPDDAPRQGIRRAMQNADAIHFSLKGLARDDFQRWLKSGYHRYDPGLNEFGWTNRELYEVLTSEHLLAKTTFYGESGEIIDEPTDWLDLS
ncbi:MAG TPA: hypothetical protein PK867_06800 [Pirellulales bacterium]|nr:hypothetical protein [Pirellulales bacterium]